MQVQGTRAPSKPPMSREQSMPVTGTRAWSLQGSHDQLKIPNKSSKSCLDAISQWVILPLLPKSRCVVAVLALVPSLGGAAGTFLSLLWPHPCGKVPTRGAVFGVPWTANANIFFLLANETSCG